MRYKKFSDVSPYLTFVLIPIMIIAAILINVAHYDSEVEDITEWSAKNHYKIITKDWQWTLIGTPFNYVHKGEYIWKLDVVDTLNQPHIIWVRTNSWSGNDYEIVETKK